MRIENEYTLKNNLNLGVNLFLGAGFSLGAKDQDSRTLPTGNELLKELQKEFGGHLNDLPTYCTYLEKTQREKYLHYLTKRFKVTSFEPYYQNLNLINIKSIFTTNIDDLIPHIFENNNNRYLNNNRVNGESTDEAAINYLPLHGNVDSPEDGYVFGLNQLANVYNANRRNWSYFSNSIEKYPTIFIGYKMADYSTISAMTNMRTFQSNAQKEKWILLYKASTEEKAFFSTMGFNIIEGSTEDFLMHIPQLVDNSVVRKSISSIELLLKNNIIPKDNRNLISRPIETFFRGISPTWNDILSNAIYKTHYFKLIQESILNPAVNTIIIGSPLSGKTTLAMMVGSAIAFQGPKLFFQDFTLNRAIYIAKIIGNQRALVIIDEFTNDIEAFKCICLLPNVSVVGVDRSQNFGNIDHLIDIESFDVINVTELTSTDVQGVLDSLPVSIKQFDCNNAKTYLDISLFEFVLEHIKGQSIQERYKEYISNLEKQDDPLADFLVLCAYMHYCRVPLSMEVAISYFSDEFDYSQVYEMARQLSDQFSEVDITTNIDAFRPRSSYLASSIINSASPWLLRRVFNGVIDNVHPLQIYNFGFFKKWAFDKELISKAFPQSQWKEGMQFYERAFLYNNENPFVLQQGALYLLGKHKYKEAFQWIDRAMTLTHNKYFSIRNSHAIIMFEANYEVESDEARLSMEKSMEILNSCYKDDKRRTFHAITYANQSIRYSRKYVSAKAQTYLKTSLDWLNEEIKSCTWKVEICDLQKKVKEQLDNILFGD